jgi:hypothetical protein
VTELIAFSTTISGKVWPEIYGSDKAQSTAKTASKKDDLVTIKPHSGA